MLWQVANELWLHLLLIDQSFLSLGHPHFISLLRGRLVALTGTSTICFVKDVCRRVNVVYFLWRIYLLCWIYLINLRFTRLFWVRTCWIILIYGGMKLLHLLHLTSTCLLLIQTLLGLLEVLLLCLLDLSWLLSLRLNCNRSRRFLRGNQRGIS